MYQNILSLTDFMIQVETIGDAYCVAAGLHKESAGHAHQISWMALYMIETCKTKLTHTGSPISVSMISEWFL